MPDPAHRWGCKREDHPRIGRRSLIQAGSLTLVGASLGELLRMEAQAAQDAPPARAKSVVFIFQSGGPSQHETWDPKPLAPDQVRGEYGTIGTRNPDLRICEYLPKLADRADRFSIVRTMHHVAGPEFRNEHSSCMYLLNTGTTELPIGETNASIVAPNPRRQEWPSLASMIAFGAGPDTPSGLPAAIDLPRASLQFTGQGPGILGPRFSRWKVDLAPPCHAPDPAGSCPNCFSHDQPDEPDRAPGKGKNAWWDNSSCRNPDFHLPDLGTAEGVAVDRVQSRATLLRELDQARRALDQQTPVTFMDAYRRQALSLILAQRGQENPFDLTQESDSVRDAYGREEWGQGFLTARRLVEAGVRMVQINLRGWDTHQNAFRDLKGKLLPSIDHCLSGFLDDLESRGLLSSTLIVMCGEMGRTPIISPIAVGGKNAAGVPFTPGRHHWGAVFPCFLAGGGIQPGRVVGRSDNRAGAPNSQAYTPCDLAATIFHLLGIGPDREFTDAEGRPYRVYRGQPIHALL